MNGTSFVSLLLAIDSANEATDELKTFSLNISKSLFFSLFSSLFAPSLLEFISIILPLFLKLDLIII